MNLVLRACAFAITLIIIVSIGILMQAGPYGLHVFARHGGTYWLPVGIDSDRLSLSMRIALQGKPAVVPGKFQWSSVDKGFEVAELPVLMDGQEVDRIFLARIDPAFFLFAVYNDVTGEHNVRQWMKQLGATLVVNGSYYSRHGEPDTPFLSNKILLGPADYDARAGAFVASPAFTGIRDLAHQNWQDAFRGADNAMVSYPLLIANSEAERIRPSQWLANRSFVGQDKSRHIIIGTTKDAFFSLDRLAVFLHDAPLGLTYALNLDGGPVASQAISLKGFGRETDGRWEMQVEGNRGSLLVWPYGDVALPIAFAVFPK